MRTEFGPGRARALIAWALACLIVQCALMAEKVVTFELLGDLPGGEYSSIANDVSGDGSVVVGESRSEDGRQAFRWAYGYCTLLNKWMYVPYSATQAGMGWVYLPK